MTLFFLVILATEVSFAEMKLVEGGQYKPLLGKGKEATVKSFLVDEVPVTNMDFFSFVKNNPTWQKGKAPTLFADKGYLKHWPKLTNTSIPVVNVSWFAANAYCEWMQKRLPTVDEWEYLSQFGPPNDEKNVKSIILEWYSKPNPKRLGKIRSTFKNKFGVWDVHGLIWEWNFDFNSTFVTGESRGDSALEKSLYCGSGAVEAADPSDYASFMRFGFRSSLKGNYTLENLGFRCAKDKEK